MEVKKHSWLFIWHGLMGARLCIYLAQSLISIPKIGLLGSFSLRAGFTWSDCSSLSSRVKKLCKIIYNSNKEGWLLFQLIISFAFKSLEKFRSAALLVFSSLLILYLLFSHRFVQIFALNLLFLCLNIKEIIKLHKKLANLLIGFVLSNNSFF